MSSFTEARFIDTKKTYEGRPLYAVEGLTFYIRDPSSKLSIQVPDGFLTDGPSIPILLLHLLPKAWVKLMVKVFCRTRYAS